MKKYFSVSLLIFLFFGVVFTNLKADSFRAKPRQNAVLAEKDLPNELKGWAKWVMDGYKKSNCHYNFEDEKVKYCYYVSSLDLDVRGKMLSFVEKVSLMDDGYVKLPGSVSLFPFDVKIDGKSVPVVDINGSPYLFLKGGKYAIAGKARSVENIRNVNIPDNAAIINVKFNGKKVYFGAVGADGVLRLDNHENSRTESDSMDVVAFRKIEDTIPIKMTLMLDINVSGRDRVEIFKNIVPENFALFNISGDVPAYVQKNGDLVVEVKAGKYNVSLEFRQIRESLDFSTKNLVSDEEIWVFVANQDRRIIQMPKSMMNIQTKNTLLPESWKKYPAYSIARNSNVSLESMKYDAPMDDNISLVRDIKLSFDGKFYSVNDELAADFKNGGRIYLEPPFNLSAVKINGVPQSITRVDGEENNGFEIRKGKYDITTNSRINRAAGEIPASGYNRVLKDVVWNLKLAPGYSLFHVSGADSVSNSWVSNWNLLDIFLLILLVVFSYYLFGTKKSIAIACLTLMLHSFLPEFTITLLILCVSILANKYIPDGNIGKKINNYVRYSLLLLLSLTMLSFMIIYIRWMVYPNLSQPTMNGYFANLLTFGFLFRFYLISAFIFIISMSWQHKKNTVKIVGIVVLSFYIIYTIGLLIFRPVYYNEEIVINHKLTANNSTYSENEVYQIKKKTSYARDKIMPEVSMASMSDSFADPDGIDNRQLQNQNITKNKIQTSLGFPSWSNSLDITIGLKGPVNSLDMFKIFLISPTLNVILAVFRLILSIYVIVFMLDVKKIQLSFNAVRKIFYILFFACVIGLNGIATASADTADPNIKVPNDEILKQLKDKLTKEDIPTCIPFCVSIPNASIKNNGNRFTLELSIHSANSIVIPLPTIKADNQNGTSLVDVKLNSMPATNLINKDGAIFLQVKEGINRVTIDTILDNNFDKFFLSSILPIGYLDNNLNGFRISSDSSKNQAIQIIRIQKDETSNSLIKNLSKMNIETFFTINRYINLGNTWQITTIVSKNNNIDENAVVEVPLLNNEKVITAEGTLLSDKLVLSFAPNETEKTFKSIIPVENEITLKYTNKAVNYNEIWNLNIDFIWNFKLEGIKPITRDGQQMLFYPASGDSLKIRISQPEGIDGNTLTFREVKYQFKPGRSMQELLLNLSAESTESGYHEILLPEESTVSDLKINSENYPVIVKENGLLVLPITQGITEISFTTKLNKNISNSLSFPVIDLKAPAVDIVEEAYIPTSRWILFTGGTLVGPSVLFWAQIPIWLCVAYLLSRFAFFPLNFVQWFILLFGFTQTNIIFTFILILWFTAISMRNYLITTINYKKLINSCLIAITILFIASIFHGISTGLLGNWNMKIIGNGSELINISGTQVWKLIWYQDLSNGLLPQAKIISLPIWIYRAIMILWSIWLSLSLVKWTKWAIASMRDYRE